MTPKQLLKPRYKVIADYPEMNKHNLQKGDILTDGGGEVVKQDGSDVWFWDYDKFPHLFSKMHWSSERTPDDLPKYIGWFQEGRFTWISPVVKWINTDNRREPLECIISFTNLDGNYEEMSMNQFDLSPATEQEYLTYKNNNYASRI